MAKHKKDISKKAFQQLEKKFTKDDKLIVGRETAELMRLASLPAFAPLVIGEDNQYAFSFAYKSPVTNTSIEAETSKSLLKRLKLTDEDILYWNTQFEQSIANWLMDKKARTGENKIEGNIKDLTRDLLRDRQQQRPKKEDYKKTEVNLKSLAIRQYIVKKKGETVVFMLVDPLTYKDTGEFTCYMSELVPKVVKDPLMDKTDDPLEKYISIGRQDYYPKQTRYAYNLRQYLVSIKNINKDIPSIRGVRILEHSGYLADVRLKRKKYRTKKASNIIEEFISLGRQFGFNIQCNKRSAGVKDIRKRYYQIRLNPAKKIDRFIPEQKKDTLADELTFLINQEPQYPDIQLCKRKAKGLLRQYGYTALKGALKEHYKGNKDEFSLNALERLLKKRGFE